MLCRWLCLDNKAARPDEAEESSAESEQDDEEDPSFLSPILEECSVVFSLC